MLTRLPSSVANAARLLVLSLVASSCGIGAADSGHTSLGRAAGQCDLVRAEQIVAAGADVNESHSSAGTAVHAAARSGGDCHVEMFELLFSAGADVTVLTPAGDNALVLLAAVGADTDENAVVAAKWLVDHGVGVCAQPVAFSNLGEPASDIAALALGGRKKSPLLAAYLSAQIVESC